VSNYRAIAATSATLRNLVQHAVQEVVPGAQVFTRRPEKETDTSRSMVFIFLYAVENNPSWRNMELPVRSSDGSLVQRPQIALDLHYLFTFYGDEDALVPQLLLGRTALALHTHPFPSPSFLPVRFQDATADPNARWRLWDSGLDEQLNHLQIIPEKLGHEEISRLWPLMLQAPYVLSAAWRVSVVLLTDDEIPNPPLPVTETRVYSTHNDLPEIQRVLPQQVDFAEGVQITLRGNNLGAAGTTVQVGGREAAVRSGSGGSLVAQLPPGLAPGIQPVQVARDVMLGRPPVPHRVFESNVASFVLRPVVLETAVRDDSILVRVAPEPAANQRPRLLLNEFESHSAEPRSFSLPAEKGHDDGVLRFRTRGVDQGTYLVRVQVGGATSPLLQDPDPQSPTFHRFIQPRIEIP
jgi:hypothetical protein